MVEQPEPFGFAGKHPHVGTHVSLVIKDRDGSTVKMAGTLRRDTAFDLAERLMNGSIEFRNARAKATLMPAETSPSQGAP
jgi:hypothetical protein